MTTISLGEYARRMGDLPKRLELPIVRALQESAAEGVSIVVGEIHSRGIDDTGGLAQSVSAEMLPNGATIKVDAPYAAIVEYGRRPGSMPPVEPLKLWVVRKLGIPASNEAEVTSIAFAIAMNIATRGTDPKRYFEAAMKTIRRRARGRIRSVLATFRA